MTSSYPDDFSNWPLEQRNAFFKQEAGRYEERKQHPLVIVSPTALCGISPPERRWLVRDWIPYGVVTALYGDGGLGKSLLAQQLQTGTALGTAWLGLPVEHVASLGVYCEDSQDELWRRQASINESYRIDFDMLNDVHWLPRLGEDNLLMTFGRSGIAELRKFHAAVLAAARDHKARLVIVDTAADTFGGNENDRGQVRQFVQRALGSIALAIDGSVILCAHPSRAGITSGEGDGGSTGWSNAFRLRLYLRGPVLQPGEPPDPNARVLERRKANYAPRKDELRLRWRQGVIEPEAPVVPGITPLGKIDALGVFLDLVQNRTLSQVSNSGNYAPRVFGRLRASSAATSRKPTFSTRWKRHSLTARLRTCSTGGPATNATSSF